MAGKPYLKQENNKNSAANELQSAYQQEKQGLKEFLLHPAQYKSFLSPEGHLMPWHVKS